MTDINNDLIFESLRATMLYDVANFVKIHAMYLDDWDHWPDDTHEWVSERIVRDVHDRDGLKHVVKLGKLDYEQVKALVIADQEREPYKDLIEKVYQAYRDKERD